MRTWTLAVSVIAHCAVVVTIVVAPIFATADLPDPRRPLTFEVLTPIAMPTAAVTSRSQPAKPATVTKSSPVDEPQELAPDVPSLLPAPRIDACESCGVVDVPVGGGPVSHDITPPPVPQAPGDPVPVGGKIQPPARVAYVAPVYPPMAVAARVQGTVILQAVIDETGSVQELRVLRGHPLLDGAAMQAVAQWRFTPTLLNGTTVPVVMTVTVTFTLRK